VIQVRDKSPNNYILLTGNYINDPTNRKPIKVTVYPFTRNGDVEHLSVIINYNYTSTKVEERISMAGLKPGYYTMVIEDPVKTYRISFSPEIYYSMVIRAARPVRSKALNYAFIYVPEGVKRFNIMKTGLLKLITPTGREISYMNNDAQDLQIEVKPGETGIWRLKPVYGDFFVEGIPPYLGTSPRQMLIPAGIK
jgi:hypothetical protein